MTKPASNVETDALSLERDARIRLAVRLLDSIENRPHGDPSEFDREWIKEAKRRYDAYIRGEDVAVPADQVFAEIRSEQN